MTMPMKRGALAMNAWKLLRLLGVMNRCEIYFLEKLVFFSVGKVHKGKSHKTSPP